MAQNFNCPHCGAVNEYTGLGDTTHCTYCGMDVNPPAEMVNKATVVRISKNVKIIAVIFVVVVVIIPLCLTMGGTLLGILGSIIGILAAIVGTIVAVFARH